MSVSIHFSTNTLAPSPSLLVIFKLDDEQAWTSILNLKSFVMDSVQVGKAVFGKEIHTTLGIEPRTILQSGEVRQPF